MRQAYHGVVEKYGLLRESTWMIGNSPNSDINPALDAGLHAVFVPHRNTWMLERRRDPPAEWQQQFCAGGWVW